MAVEFTYPPTPEILQWLAAGQLGNRMVRSLRLWVLLSKLYGPPSPWGRDWEEGFAYSQLRDRLFSSTHSTRERLAQNQSVPTCNDWDCICHRTFQELVTEAGESDWEGDWREETIRLTGLTPSQLEAIGQGCPFATVHRTLRDDLKHLAELGWLQWASRGSYKCIPPTEWPAPPHRWRGGPTESPITLSAAQFRELLPLLEDISFIQPNLELLIQSFWDASGSANPDISGAGACESRRIFIHLDYILPPALQDRVDTYQEQLERLWRTASSGVVRFEYEVSGSQTRWVSTYPVCLHYVRRAKYLSAWGETPDGEMGWHNFRLDRIVSPRLTVLVWGDPQVPKLLRTMRRNGELPGSEEVAAELEGAWGFNFYLPRKLLLLRFPRGFADRYVDNTVRHLTFKPVAYGDVGDLVRKYMSQAEGRDRLLRVLASRSPEDAYYRAWIRLGDINVLMRLRDWRPKGEVILPLSVRQQMADEARLELSFYQ